MANLLKWGKDRLKQVNGVQHQLNPWDGGRTYDTNQRSVAPGTPNPVNIRDDNTPGFQLTNNSLTRGASRVFDQVNPVDNNRTWKQRAPVGPNRSTGQQLWNTGATGSLIQGVVKPVQHTANTVGALAAGTIGLGQAGYESIFGSDQDYQNKLNETNQAMNDLLDHGWGNAGGFATSKQAQNADLFGTPQQRSDFIKPVIKGVAEDAPLVVPFGAGKGASLLTKAAVGGGENAVVGGATNAAQQYVDTGQISKKEVLKNAAISGVIGAAIPVGGAIVKDAAGRVVPFATDAASKLNPANIAANHPAVLQLNETISGLNAQRGKMSALGMSEKAPAMVQNAKAVAMAVAERDKTVKGIAEGGYIKVPGGKTPEEPMLPTNKRPQGDLQTQIEAAHNAGDTKLEAKLNAKLKDPAMSSTPEVMTPERRAELMGKMKATPKPVEGQGKDLVPQPGKLSELGSDSTPTPPHPLNVDKFNITKNAKKALKDVQVGIKDDIEKTRGAKLTNKEVREHMAATKTVLESPKTRNATKNYIAGLQTLREDNAALLNKRGKGTITPEESARLNSGLLKQYAAAADAGRTLRAFAETADPNERTVLDMMLKKIGEKGEDLKAASEAASKLGPNATAKEQAEFYRTFVKATKEDWLDKYRYTNMLSSPLTHIVNMSSNLGGVGVIAPAQKLFEGGVDAARAVLTRSDRTRFAGEAGAFYKGAGKAIPEALHNFHDVMTGKRITGNPDMDSLRNVPLATHGAAGVADKVLSFVPKLLEAGDQLGTTLAKGGEEAALRLRESRGVKVDLSPESVLKLTDDSARYRLFRQELNKTGQGHLLDAVDIPAQTISKMRQSKNPYVRNIAKFTVPFIATPTNIFKQGIEYSPLGVFTLHGAADKTAQAAKTLMGVTTVATAIGALGAGGDITFGEPTNKDQRNAFRAEGKQPYSFKLPGSDKWIGYSKMHPAIAMNLAIVGAIKDAEDKGSITDSQATRAMNTGAGIINYFTDQSYMKNVGDFVNILGGKDNTNPGSVVSSTATNNINQLIPFKSLTSWAGRIVDPTQRSVDSKASTAEQTYQGIVKDIPGLNSSTPTRNNPYTGQPLTNPHPLLNSFSPNRVSTDKGFGNTTGLNIDQREQLRDLPNDQREVFRRNVIETKAADKAATQEKADIQAGKDVPFKSTVKQGSTNTGNSDIKQLSSGKYYTKVGNDYKTFDTKDKAQQAVDVQNFKDGDAKKKVIGSKVYLKSDNEQGYTVKSKVEYDFDNNDSKINLEMDRAKSNDDVNGWLTSAQSRYDGYQKLLDSYDPEIDQAKINDLTKKMEDLKDTADKYQGYGGFTKGGGKAKKGFQAPTKNTVDFIGGVTKTADLVASAKVSKAARLRRKF